MRSQDVILGMLMEGSASGYDMKRKLETLFSHFYHASYGTIYPMLSKMEQDGLITKECLQQDGKPNKNMYTITERGKRAFEVYLESELQEAEVKSDLMIRLYFGAYARPELVEAWLRTSILKAEQTLKLLDEERDIWYEKLPPTQRICFDIGVTNTENILRNLREGLLKLQSEAHAQGSEGE